MAHNSGFYQQGQPVQQQQQQQYSPMFQQPMNIYQQLGKPQPQPHLQSHPTYTAPLQQPQQQQPIQSQGFQFNQPQYVQAPPQPQQMQAPYVLSQTPYAPSQTPYQPSQTPYIPSQTPFSSQAPYPISQTAYAPAPITYPQQQQSNTQFVAPQQQQAQPVYAQPTQPQISHIPTSSFPNQSSSAIPLNSSGSSWRVATSRPPPVALSATLAQQAQAQAQSAQPQPQIQIPQQAPPAAQQQQTTSTPQTPGRRPLPQPAPGVNAKTPALPPPNTPKRIPTLPNANAIPSGSSKPFPIEPIQTNIPQASKTPSPTRGRPLPTPTESGNKRNTVDLGKLPHTSFGSTAGSSAFSNASTASSASGSGWPVKKVDTSPTRSVLPSLSEQKTSNNANVQLSRTSSYAVNLASSDSSPSKTTTSFPKRRESPPRFQSAPSSESNSPTKENPPTSTWNRSNSSSSTNLSSSSAPAPPAPRAIASSTSQSSSSTKSSAADANFVASPTSATSSSSSATAPPKKFVPMWRRTIPEMPAPAWGYAAGMVSEPHPQPPPPPEPPAPAPAVAASPEKSKGKGGKLKKLFKGSSSSAPAPVPAPAPPAAAPAPRAAQYQANPSQGLNSGYPRANVSPVQQRYPAYQQQIAQYAQPQAQPRAYTSQPQQQQYQHYRQQQQQQQEEEEEEETEEEETEEDEEEEEEEEEEETEETEETEEDESDHRYHIHTRQRSQPQAQSKGNARMRSQSRGRHAYEEEEEEQTPKRKVLRPKAPKVDPYTDISPSGKAKIKPKLAPRRMELDENPSPKTKLRPKAKALARSTLEDEEEEEVDLERTPKKKNAIHERERQILEARRLKHERSRSAFEERDIARHRREPSEREQRPRSGSAFAGSAPTRKGKSRYEEEEEEEEDDISLRLAYDDEEEEEDDSELEWLKKQKAMKKRRAAAAREAQRSETSSPQYGIRDLKPANRRAGSGSDSRAAPASRYGNRYEEPSEEEEEQEYRQRRPVTAERQVNRNGKEREWDYEQPERRYQNVGMGNGKGTGLPQPPMMRDSTTSQDRQIRGGPRLKSAPIKFDDYDPDEHRRQTSARDNLPMQFSSMNMNGNSQENRNRSDSRGSAHSSAHSSAWPVDLPRLPRTPGSATTPGSVMNDGGGYFDIKPQPQSIPNPPTNFGNRQNQSQGDVNRNNYRERIQNHRTNLDLDDPPPQATVVRTPSPGPTGYTLSQRRELPQPQGRPQSQAFPPSAERVAQQLARRRSLYNAPSASTHQEDDNMSKPRRPQSQVYDVQNSQMHQHNHQIGRSHPPSASSAQFASAQLNHPFNVPRQQPQTPAPPPTVGIESPHPIGGREKLADIPKMEEDSNDGSDNEHHRGAPRIQVDSAPPSIPMINVNSSPMGNGGGGGVPMINIDSVDNGSPRMRNNAPQAPQIQVFEVPGISVAGPFDGPSISISGPDDLNQHQHQHPQQQQQQSRPLPPQSRPQTGSDFGGRQSRPGAGGLICGGCNGPIIGRIVSAMGSRYHPACFKCTVCNELLEHVSSYEHDGRPYCHLDYHENFAPRCYSCKTPIVEEQFISLDDPALGKRAYHTQHFFCSECGDPFLTPSGGLPTNSQGELAVTGDGEFEGFTVYKGYPYCEACHVRLRLPKCKRCKRSIRDSDQAVEALGGKWCWACFVCASCHKPFENPSFFQRDDQPYCEHCFSIMLRNEI
ncbi:Paxillin [Psilocybe cubensis]|uniref:LIM zinc-binding domain-containing protein n=2 Tax=Psilocybe cubensis TaxID=181762 RepID=A0A8H7XWT9_PSICU|nr:Paxillin [Psilocybe cubensis]KAH9478682.1 Paxillin [Psilocybe cubensis]